MKTKLKTLRPVRPNLGIEAEYRRRLRKLIDDMANSIEYWIGAAYNQNTPELAQDASPSVILHNIVRKLARRWQRKFNELAPQLARYFTLQIHQRSEAALKKMLKDSGFAVEFKMTPAMHDVLSASVKYNVSLIRSIPQKHFHEIEGLVMHSVQTGRDLKYLNKELLKRFDITKKRAALIARDQNNKVNAALTRARQMELGIQKAVWMHSHAGKVPRWQHVAMDGKTYDLNQGMWDPVEKKYVHPGELINCRCTQRAVIPGLG